MCLKATLLFVFQAMRASIEQFARQPEHAVSDCCVVCLLSHGVEGSIYGVDGKLLEVSLFSKLINSNSGISIQTQNGAIAVSLISLQVEIN